VVWASTAFQEAHAARVAAELRGVRVDHFDYWLATTELWSRAYAQYIVSVTRDVGLRVQLDEVWGSGVVYHWVYWEERDFARILEAVDRLFRQKEWR
jgi:hypothetical protein